MRTSLFITTIAITCSIVFMTAHAEASRDHERRSDTTIKFYGRVEKMPEKGYNGTWVIGGKEVLVNNTTRIKRKYGPVKTGDYVEVKASKTGAGYTAYKIEIEREHNSGYSQARFYGKVEDVPKNKGEGIWKVNGRRLIVTADTRIKEKYGRAVIGAYVEIKGAFSNKDFIVHEIEVKDNHHNSR